MNEKASRTTVVEFGDYKPRQPQPYKFPNIVTRDNFAAVLSGSFRVSGALDNRQILFFELLKAHTGFDHRSSIQNFLHAGGWNTFSPEEQALFMKDFEGVRAHTNPREWPTLWRDFHGNPTTKLHDQLSIYLAYDDVVGNLTSTFEAQYGPLVGMNQRQFIGHLNEIYPLRSSK